MKQHSTAYNTAYNSACNNEFWHSNNTALGKQVTTRSRRVFDVGIGIFVLWLNRIWNWTASRGMLGLILGTQFKMSTCLKIFNQVLTIREPTWTQKMRLKQQWQQPVLLYQTVSKVSRAGKTPTAASRSDGSWVHRPVKLHLPGQKDQKKPWKCLNMFACPKKNIEMCEPSISEDRCDNEHRIEIMNWNRRWGARTYLDGIWIYLNAEIPNVFETIEAIGG